MKRSASQCVILPYFGYPLEADCGKIDGCMNTSSDIKIEKPKVIQALLSGFNIIASKPYLILLPVLLDLFLWFGPGWRIDEYFKPLIQSFSNLPGLNTPEYSEIISAFQAFWQDVLSQFNLAVTLSTLPIGVPSLMTGEVGFMNPLGSTTVFELTSNLQILGIWLIFVAIGFSLGNVYFQNISKEVLPSPKKPTMKSFLWSFLQIVLMPIFLLIVLMILSIPILLVISLVTVLSPAISDFVIFIIAIILLWVVMPLVFTPHSIYLYKQNLISAMMTSISVVKVSMGQTSWFLLASYILVRGFNTLWKAPASDSWFLLVGILGHAFIVSAVIAASFYYFVDATKFTQTIVNKNLKLSD